MDKLHQGISEEVVRLTEWPSILLQVNKKVIQLLIEGVRIYQILGVS